MMLAGAVEAVVGGRRCAVAMRIYILIYDINLSSYLHIMQLEICPLYIFSPGDTLLGLP